LPGLNKLWK